MGVSEVQRRFLFLFLFCFAFFLSTANAQISQTKVSLKNPGFSLLHKATYLKPLEPQKRIHFTVWLKLKNKNKLNQLLSELYDPKSANYQKFLKPGEFEQEYAPSNDAENTVANYFRSQGMEAQIVNHRIEVTAKAQQIINTLQTPLNYYRYQNRIVYATAKPPKLKSDIAQYISQVSGLNNMPRFHPMLRERPKPLNENLLFKPHNFSLRFQSFVPFAQPTTTSFVGFTGTTLRSTFNLANIAPINGTAINGTGQTLIIIDACGTHTAAEIMSDANLYNAANNLTPFSASNFAVINRDGTPFTTCASPDSSWDNEIALDIEASHAIAPGANTVLVLAENDFNPLDLAIDDVTNRLINNNFTIAGFSNAYVVSNSWGGSETTGSEPGVESTLEKAAAHGISFNFSTGDCGDQTYNSSWPCTIQGATPTVEFPASSAFVTAVGGTSLFVDNNWNYAFEALWGSRLDSGFYAGTTGGVSQFYGPVTWQSSISGFTAGGYAGTVGSYNKRVLPDISMSADPYTGLTIYAAGTSFVYGGTSLACPLFSGALVLLNQARALLNGGTARPIGQAAPYFYVNNSTLLRNQALNLVVPPHNIIAGAKLPPTGAPISAFKLRDEVYGYELTFGWDSSLTIQPENQFWNDGVGVGSINIPNFLSIMATI